MHNQSERYPIACLSNIALLAVFLFISLYTYVFSYVLFIYSSTANSLLRNKAIKEGNKVSEKKT